MNWSIELNSPSHMHSHFIGGEASSLSKGGMVDCDLVANLQSVGGGRGPPARSIKGTLHYIFEPACNNSGESGSEEGI